MEHFETFIQKQIVCVDMFSCVYVVIFFRFIYLEDRMTQREGDTYIQREQDRMSDSKRERDPSSIAWFTPKLPQQPGLHQQMPGARNSF